MRSYDYCFYQTPAIFCVEYLLWQDEFKSVQTKLNFPFTEIFPGYNYIVAFKGDIKCCVNFHWTFLRMRRPRKLNNSCSLKLMDFRANLKDDTKYLPY